MDMYVYPFGNPGRPLVLKDVSYGAVFGVHGGQPGAVHGGDAPASAPPASSKPALTTSFMVGAGAAYTLAALGPDPGLRTEVLKDQMTAPAGQAVVRVLQASLKQHLALTLARSATGRTSSRGSLASGPPRRTRPSRRAREVVRFTAPGQHTAMPVTLPAGTVHTIVVLDDSSGLKVDAVTNAVGSQIMPEGRGLRRVRRDRTTPARESRAMADGDRGRGPATTAGLTRLRRPA